MGNRLNQCLRIQTSTNTSWYLRRRSHRTQPFSWSHLGLPSLEMELTALSSLTRPVPRATSLITPSPQTDHMYQMHCIRPKPRRETLLFSICFHFFGVTACQFPAFTGQFLSFTEALRSGGEGRSKIGSHGQIWGGINPEYHFLATIHPPTYLPTFRSMRNS